MLLKSDKSLLKHVLQNALVGLFLVLVIHHFKDVGWLQNQQNQALDWVMYFGANQEQENVTPFIFVDVDNSSYAEWGEPTSIPADKMVTMLKNILQGSPSSVVIDFDLSRRSDDDVAVIEDYLREYNASILSENKSQVIIVKTFKVLADDAESKLLQPRESLLDPIVNEYKWLHWGSPLFTLDDDYNVRRWRLWEAACTKKGASIAIPSVQLLLYANQSLSGGIKELTRTFESFKPEDCNDWDKVLLTELPTLGRVTLNKQKAPLSQRIYFNLAWQKENPDPYAYTEIIYESPNGDVEHIMEPLLADIPASLLSKQNTELDNSLFTNKNVIIGASHQDSADIHGTPLGHMPGSLIIVNAVNSLQTKGELVNPSLMTTLIIEFILLVIISIAFAMLIPSVAFILSTGFIVLVLLPITYWVFKDGVWLDFALPLFAVQMHQLVSSAEHSVQNKFKSSK